MNDPTDHLRLSTMNSLFTERLADRASGRAGVVDTEHPNVLYRRAETWIQQRLPLLTRLQGMFGTGEKPLAPGESLVMGQPLPSTEYTPLPPNIAPQSERILRKAEDSVPRMRTADSAPAAQGKYRVSRRAPYAALRSGPVPVIDSFHPGAVVGSSDSVTSAEGQSGSEQSTAHFDVEPQIVTGDRGSGDPAASTSDSPAAKLVQRTPAPSPLAEGPKALARLTLRNLDAREASANIKSEAGVDAADARREVDGSQQPRETPARGEYHTSVQASGLEQTRQSRPELAFLKEDYRIDGPENTPPVGREGMDIGAGDGSLQSEARAGTEPRSSIQQQTITQSQQAPAEMVLLKRDTSALAVRENRDAALIELPAEDSRLSTPLGIDNQPSPKAFERAREDASSSVIDDGSGAVKLVTAALNQPQISRTAEPLVLDKPSENREAPSTQRIRRTATGAMEGTRLGETFGAGEGSAVPRSGESQFKVQGPLSEDVFRDLIQKPEPLILRETDAVENDTREETQSAAPRAGAPITQDQTHQPASGQAAESTLAGKGNGGLPPASSLKVSPSLPVLKLKPGTTSPRVQRHAEASRESAAPSSKERFSSQSIVAPEGRASRIGSEPGLVWRKNAGGSSASSLVSDHIGSSTVFVARQSDGSGSTGSPPSAGPSVSASAPPENSAAESGGGVDVDSIIRALRKKLAIERERRGTGRWA